jgi:hypothetical protein
MKTSLPSLKIILILIIVIISYSCERDGFNSKTLSTENPKTNFEIPKPKIQYNITWNNFGEITTIEHTTQNGFVFLEILQEYE